MIDRLDATIKAAGIPIDGLSPRGDGSYRIDGDLTAEQHAAAQTVIGGFDWSQEADAAWREDLQPERKSLKQAAAQAAQDNTEFLALSNPTNAQLLAQLRRLSQQNTAVIRRLVQIER